MCSPGTNVVIGPIGFNSGGVVQFTNYNEGQTFNIAIAGPDKKTLLIAARTSLYALPIK